MRSLLSLLVVAAVAWASVLPAEAQVPVPSPDTPVTFSFEGDAPSNPLYNTRFDGAGIDPAPFAGQLNASAFAISGLSDGDVAFGEVGNSGDFARGASTGGVSTGGLYGFNTGSATTPDYSIGLQPTGSDATPGEMYLCFQNQTGAEVEDVNVAYDLNVYNDQDRSQSVALEYNVNSSACDVSQSTSSTGVSALTPGTADGSPSWTTDRQEAYVSNLGIADGSFFVLKIVTDDADGSGARDEIGIDNLTVTFSPSTPIPVELAAFDVSAEEKAALLTWTTASETNNAGFRILHRAPAEDAFRSIGQVDGAGTTGSPVDYDFRTDPLASGRHAFQLQQVDTDGTTTRGPIRTVRIRGDAPVRLTGPNPVQPGESPRVVLDVASTQDVTVALYNVLGQRVQTLYEGTATRGRLERIPVATDDLASGTYFVRTTGANVQSTRRVTVVR